MPPRPRSKPPRRWLRNGVGHVEFPWLEPFPSLAQTRPRAAVDLVPTGAGAIKRASRFEKEQSLDGVVVAQVDSRQPMPRLGPPEPRGLANVGGGARYGGEDGVVQGGRHPGRSLERRQLSVNDRADGERA